MSDTILNETIQGILIGCAIGYFMVAILGIIFGFLDNCDAETQLHNCGRAILWPAFVVVFFIKAFIAGASDLADYTVEAVKYLISN